MSVRAPDVVVGRLVGLRAGTAGLLAKFWGQPSPFLCERNVDLRMLLTEMISVIWEFEKIQHKKLKLRQTFL